MAEKTYIAIDLKSFYASCECVARGLDPMDTNLVVADATRTEKTICLAVSPSLKAYGISGRARLFEVVSRMRDINRERYTHAPSGFIGTSYSARELAENSALEAAYLVAPPRMAYYMETSAEIYKIYSSFVSPEDIHVYSVDEVFIDATSYLHIRGISAREFAGMMIQAVLRKTGITATAGIGENLYLCKVAMDIVAKHIPADENGVRIAELTEQSYRERLWSHEPITDFWRVGHGIAGRLASMGLHTMGDIARQSQENEEPLYRTFGINAELLIDHAWGWEPCTIADIKAYKPQSNSLSSGQVLTCAYTAEKARMIALEMTDTLVLDLVERMQVTDLMDLVVCYDTDNLKEGNSYRGDVILDRYGRKVPKQAHGSVRLAQYTSSTRLITEAMGNLYDRIVDHGLLVRRIYVTACNVLPRDSIPARSGTIQLDLFSDPAEEEQRLAEEKEKLSKEQHRQETILDIRRKFGKNAILRGANLQKESTQIERNGQIGGHKAE